MAEELLQVKGIKTKKRGQKKELVHSWPVKMQKFPCLRSSSLFEWDEDRTIKAVEAVG